MDFNRFFSKLGITHTTSSPLYPQSNGFVEIMVQIVKTMLSKNSVTQSSEEVLADLRATCMGMGLPSPAEILHGRNPATKEACHVDYKAIRSMLQERQLKMNLSHNKSHRAKKAYCLLLWALETKLLKCFITGTHDTGRSYDIQIEGTGAKLTRNCFQIRPKNYDIPLIHELYLQPKTVLSGADETDMSNITENSVPSEASDTPRGEQLATRMSNSKMVLQDQVIQSHQVHL